MICQENEGLLQIAEERRHPVEITGAGVVGAAAGVHATVPHGADLAFRGSIATLGDDEVLSCPVNTGVHMTKGELRAVALSHQAGTGEEIAIINANNVM